MIGELNSVSVLCICQINLTELTESALGLWHHYWKIVCSLATKNTMCHETKPVRWLPRNSLWLKQKFSRSLEGSKCQVKLKVFYFEFGSICILNFQIVHYWENNMHGNLQINCSVLWMWLYFMLSELDICILYPLSGEGIPILGER